uniref:SJCHGC06437 protein n=1 Tax=Schistosoma japonicum TaxID=6182 RepID=Q5DAL7_SCHJA|nr:SJCHGC06437 protein [Schistosoma japonicum]
MTSRRSGVGLAVVNNQLIAIGGFDGATYLKSVELYDPDANCWSVRGSMNSRRLGGGVGVVRLVNPHFNLNNTSLISNNSISNYSTTSRSVGGYMNNNVIGTSCNNSMINDDSLGLSMTDSIFPPGLPISSTNQCHHNSNNVSSSNNSIGGNSVSQSIIRNLTTSALASTLNSSSTTATVSLSSVSMNSGHMNLASTRSNSTFLF